jgi:hypothetical protein
LAVSQSFHLGHERIETRGVGTRAGRVERFDGFGMREPSRIKDAAAEDVLRVVGGRFALFAPQLLAPFTRRERIGDECRIREGPSFEHLSGDTDSSAVTHACRDRAFLKLC